MFKEVGKNSGLQELLPRLWQRNCEPALCPALPRVLEIRTGSDSTGPGVSAAGHLHLSHLWFAKYSKEGPPPPSTDKQHQHPLRTC